MGVCLKEGEKGSRIKKPCVQKLHESTIEKKEVF